ncbi:NADH:quinone oxidoreductase [Celeribacter sp.]|uniref:NADH:quinone oxidoreductase n=1 Tax=Celeribacter sp. TaxID=1890673 RepID=UPI003A923D0F
MSESNSGKTPKIWLISAICGVLAFLALLFIAGYSTVASMIIGVLVTLLVAILLWIGWYDEPVQNKAVPATPGASVSGTTTGAVTGSVDAQSVASPSASAASAVGLMSAAPVSGASANDEPAPEVAESATTAKAPAKKTAAKATKAKAKTTATKASAAPAKAAKPKAPAAPKAKAAAPKASAKPKRAAVAADGKPADVLLSAARGGQPDDLKLLKGVGPKIEAQLHALGFYHFDQIASLRKKETEWLDENLVGTSARQIETWKPDAKTLAAGGQTEFSKRAKY